ncbi:hypothetical protein Lgra_2243 [Legionella gratiana]|uniref:Uncharacterized protein n=1 Tax=Legionella gratiana TaxID=45066 RepID=A0A378JEB8_9GAMM|nr:hypothetical protein [Legionella gratiana]KTD09008.1 hypothetical protein Lgra_2243 [Legionella gratiana]STX45779.1 Uncharacterised protein [Legionella gratiana]
MKKNDIEKYAFEEEIFTNPAEVYTRLKERLIKEGPLAPMPEYEGIIQELIENLNHPFILDLINHDNTVNLPLRGALANQYAQALLGLRHVALEVELEQEEIDAGYPHRPHTHGRYPYQPTLEAISKAMDFFDTVERIAHTNNIPLYHADRYTHYELSFKHKEGMIIVPSSRPLSLEDLIYLRAYAALAFTGVSTKTLFTDAYHNTPKDFWVHDINHNRRFMSYDDRYCELHNCTREEAYRQFAKTINEVIFPSIKIDVGMSKHEINKRNMMKAIYFEFLHEYAFTPDVDSLKKAFRFKAGDPAPFEIMIKSQPKNIESLRMQNNNLQSGVFGAGKNIDSRSTRVKYFHDTVGPNFITSLYNKLTHSFYDNKYFSTSELPPLNERTPELVADAALAIMDVFEINQQELGLNREKLILLALNKDAHGKILGRVEGYPNQSLKKPELKREIVEKVILSERKNQLNVLNNKYTLFKDDTVIGTLNVNTQWHNTLKDTTSPDDNTIMDLDLSF